MAGWHPLLMNWPISSASADNALSAEGSIEIQDLREEPRCDRSRKRDGTVREYQPGVYLSKRDALVVAIEQAN